MSASEHQTVQEKPIQIVEFVGLAGSGKTTLIQMLSKRAKQVRVGVTPRKSLYIPFYIENWFAFFPMYLLHYRQTHWFDRDESRSLVYLKAWRYVLIHHPSDSVTLLDHGPVFRLALLSEFGPEITRSLVFKRWWNTQLCAWASTLDALVWLDAPDDVLLGRIESRNRWHLIKNKPELEANKFLHRYRSSYQEIMQKMSVIQGPKILSFDTNRESQEQIVDQLLAELSLVSK